MKQFFLTATCLLISIAFLFAQDVEIKDNKVLLDGKEILKCKKVSLLEYSFYLLENDDEILQYKYSNNETAENSKDDYYALKFLTEKKKVESTDFSKVFVGVGLNSKKNMQKIITWLIKEKVLTSEGKINQEKLDVFVEKYNENILQRTIR